MAKLSREERAALEKQLADDDAADDDADEVEYTHSDGRKLRGSYRRVSDFAGALGTKLKPEPPPDKPETKDGEKRFTAGRRTT